jgi:hypothetical protein
VAPAVELLKNNLLLLLNLEHPKTVPIAFLPLAAFSAQFKKINASH